MKYESLIPVFEKLILPISVEPSPLSPQGHLQGNIDAVLFDLQGTLLTCGSGDAGFSQAITDASDKLRPLMKKYGIPQDIQTFLKVIFSNISNHHQVLREKGVDYPEAAIEEIFEQILGKDDPETIKSFAAEFDLLVNPVYPMPNLKEMVEGLRAEGIELGVVSNAQFYMSDLLAWILKKDLESAGFREELLIYSYLYSHAKPSEYLFELSVNRLFEMGIEKENVLYVGNDAVHDIAPAKKTGFKTALFAGDAKSLNLKKGEEFEADIVITDLMQLLDHMDTKKQGSK